MCHGLNFINKTSLVYFGLALLFKEQRFVKDFLKFFAQHKQTAISRIK